MLLAYNHHYELDNGQILSRNHDNRRDVALSSHPAFLALPAGSGWENTMSKSLAGIGDLGKKQSIVG
jgi:hypothetical protein